MFLLRDWIIFSLIQGSDSGPKNKVPVFGKASLNLSEFASSAEEKEIELNIPLIVSSGATEPRPSLHVCTLRSFCVASILCLKLIFP